SLLLLDLLLQRLSAVLILLRFKSGGKCGNKIVNQLLQLLLQLSASSGRKFQKCRLIMVIKIVDVTDIRRRWLIGRLGFKELLQMIKLVRLGRAEGKNIISAIFHAYSEFQRGRKPFLADYRILFTDIICGFKIKLFRVAGFVKDVS